VVHVTSKRVLEQDGVTVIKLCVSYKAGISSVALSNLFGTTLSYISYLVTILSVFLKPFPIQ
jgi:hypothetical protein